MARSTYIYVVMRADADASVRAAFTVKHEMVTWLRRQDDTVGTVVLRVRDGYPGCQLVDVADLLGGA